MLAGTTVDEGYQEERYLSTAAAAAAMFSRSNSESTLISAPASIASRSSSGSFPLPLKIVLVHRPPRLFQSGSMPRERYMCGATRPHRRPRI